MTTHRAEIPHWILLAGMFLLALLTWPSAPDRIPVHWNIDGQVDRFGGKFEGLLLLPLIATGVYLLMRFLPRVDPGRANYGQFQGAYAVIRILVLGLLAAVYAITHLTLRGHPVDMGTVMPVLLGALFVALGALMGKIRPNWFVGIRTPWTLSSKLSWVKTHRLGGFLMVAAGLLTMASAALGPRVAFATLMASALGSAAASMAYSWRVWKHDPDKLAPAGSLPGEEPPRSADAR